MSLDNKRTKHVIIGTAGHVDHGKTTLIKALTGTDTDRLKEEQERGMTIDLGFAALTLPDGSKAGIVDVPGHERFLKNMLAGAVGVDVALLVVAADESVMPQTTEHLEILHLLDVRNGVVALTKCDTVDREWIAAVEEDIRKHLQGTFLQTAPIVRVDSVRGRGVPELKRALQSAVSRAIQKNTQAPFRLPIDRVFTRPGFGTVVTGTLAAGTMHVGDAVEILPTSITSRVRGLQSHGVKQESVEAGMRVAVNLAGVEQNDLERGSMIAAPGVFTPTRMFDGSLKMLASAPVPLANRMRVRIYLGTAEIIGRIHTLGCESIKPGSQGYVQFRAEISANDDEAKNLMTCMRGDRYILRTYSPMFTVGGGTVLDSSPSRHKAGETAIVDALKARERGTPEDLLETWLAGRPYGGTIREAVKEIGVNENELNAASELLQAAGKVEKLESGRLIHCVPLAQAQNRALSTLDSYHAAHPLRSGMPKEELRSAIGRSVDARAFAALLSHWQAAELVVADGSIVRCASFTIQLGPRQQALYDKIVDLYKTAGFTAPSIDEICNETGVAPDAVAAMLRVGAEQSLFIRISDDLYYLSETLEEAKRLVREYDTEHGGITIGQFRDLTGSSRRYALPLLEYFDAVKFTRRTGDIRRVTSSED